MSTRPSPPKRKALGWERGLFALPAHGYFLVAALCMALAAMALATVRDDDPIGPTLVVRGRLRSVREVHQPSFWIDVTLEDRAERFRRIFVDQSPALIAAVRAGIPHGTELEIEVERSELEAARRRSPDDANVFVVALRSPQGLLATRAELEAAYLGNRRIARYFVYGSALLGLVFVWAGQRRRKLLAVDEEVRADVVQSARIMALRPPFRLRRGYALRQLAVVAIAVGFTGPMAAFGLSFALHEANEVMRDDAIWRDGLRSRAAVESNLVREQDRTTTQRVTLRLLDGGEAGRRVRMDLELGATELPDIVEARFLPREPSRVVIQALVERRGRRLVFVALSVALGSVFAGLSWFLVLRARARLDVLRSVARDGQVVPAELVSVTAVHVGQAPQREVVYRLRNGDEGREQYDIAAPGPLMADARHVLVLASLDGRSHVLLREDGYPLAL